METGYLTINSYPQGANIYIDGILVLDDKGDAGTTPAILTLNTGDHRIKLELAGYCDEFDNQFIEKNENVVIFHNFYIC